MRSLADIAPPSPAADVLIDIPYVRPSLRPLVRVWTRLLTSRRPFPPPPAQFMSHHKQKMVDAVAMACNKTYRLWMRRHPEFEEKGRVHIIAHSVRLAPCFFLRHLWRARGR